MIEFIEQFFIDPIYSGEGYNTYNTIVYGLLLGVCILLADGLLGKLKINIDRRFVFGLFPFITLAAILRSLVDASILPRSFFLITPGIFLTTFLIAIFVLLFAKYLEKWSGVGYQNTMFVVGTVLLVYPVAIAVSGLVAPIHFISIVILTGISSWATILIFKKMDFGTWNDYIITAHMLDASATFLAVEYLGYFEEHVFENFLILLFDTALVIYPLKIVVLGIVLAGLKKLDGGPFWYFALIVLGYAPGLRDALTIMLLG